MYISAAQRAGWDLPTGRLIPVATTEGDRGCLSLHNPDDGEPAKLSADGRPAEPLHDALLSSGRPASKSLAGTAVDEIMQIGGWRTETVLHRGFLQ